MDKENREILLEQLRWETAKYSHAAWSNCRRFIMSNASDSETNDNGNTTIPPNK